MGWGGAKGKMAPSEEKGGRHFAAWKRQLWSALLLTFFLLPSPLPWSNLFLLPVKAPHPRGAGCGGAPHLSSPLSHPQIAAMKAASPTRSAIPGVGLTRRAAICWSACAWATARASGPASPWVRDGFVLPQLGCLWFHRGHKHWPFCLPQPRGAMITRPGRPMWWVRPGRSPTRAGWWWTAPAWGRAAAASPAPPEVRWTMLLSICCCFSTCKADWPCKIQSLTALPGFCLNFAWNGLCCGAVSLQQSPQEKLNFVPSTSVGQVLRSSLNCLPFSCLGKHR